jgi:simple sugar transport system permease protein
MSEVTSPMADRAGRMIVALRRALAGAAIPVLAIFTALVVSAGVLALTEVNPIEAFVALAEGALVGQAAIVTTLIKTTPFVFVSLGLALAFRGGLFNIGAEGQVFVGAILAVLVGYGVSLPAVLHLPLVLLAGAAGGAAWAFIPGYLKARTGAHEVITTIMTNFVALRIINWLIGSDGPMRASALNPVPETRPVLETARLPLLIADTRLHAGVLLAPLAALLVYWLLWRTTLGFEIRTVGANPSAARYAGINVGRNIVLTMMLSGALAGLAGGVQVVGLAPYNFTTGFNVGYGFDSIAVTMLGSLHPFGVMLASFLFGIMDSGGRIMQLRTRAPIDILTILQGLLLMFVAAHQIIRAIYRIRVRAEEGPVNLGRLWAGESAGE